MAKDRPFNEQEKNALREAGYSAKEWGGGVLTWTLDLDRLAGRYVLVNDEIADDVIVEIVDVYGESIVRLEIEDTTDAVALARELAFAYGELG